MSDDPRTPLVIERLTKRYGRIAAVQDLTLSVEPGLNLQAASVVGCRSAGHCIQGEALLPVGTCVAVSQQTRPFQCGGQAEFAKRRPVSVLRQPTAIT